MVTVEVEAGGRIQEAAGIDLDSKVQGPLHGPARRGASRCWTEGNTGLNGWPSC